MKNGRRRYNTYSIVNQNATLMNFFRKTFTKSHKTLRTVKDDGGV